jgi:hypothetical protein
MKRAWLVNLLLVIGVTGLALYAIYRPKPEDKTPRHKLSQVAAAAVQKVRIEPRDAPPIELERRGEAWFITAPLTGRADQSQLDRLLDLLQASSTEKLPADDLARYDLDRPRLKVQFDGQVLAFGTSNPLTQEQYVLAGDSVYLLSSYFTSVVPSRPDRLLTHALFRPGERPVAFALKGFRVTQKDATWTVEPPLPEGKEAPGPDEINRWVDNWRFASSLVTRPASGRKPLDEIQATLAGGAQVKFGVLQRAPELVLLRQDEKLEFQFSAESGAGLMTRPEPAPPPAGAPSDAASGVEAR